MLPSWSKRDIQKLWYRLTATSFDLVLLHKESQSLAELHIDRSWALFGCWPLLNPCVWIQQVLHAEKDTKIALGDFSGFSSYIRTQVILDDYSLSIRVFGTAIIAHDEVCTAHFQLTLAVLSFNKHSLAVLVHSHIFIWGSKIELYCIL